MQATAGPFPRADAAPTQPQGRSGKHCVASAHKRSVLEVEVGGVWGREAFLRPFLHWQCQHGTVPYTVPYFTVITVKYGVTITVVRHNLTSTVRTVQTVIVPYRTTRQAWKGRCSHKEATCTAILLLHLNDYGLALPARFFLQGHHQLKVVALALH
jgi:hypothetical protein